MISSETMFPKEWARYQISKDRNITYVYAHSYGKVNKMQTEVRYYRVCSKLWRFFLESSGPIFQWIYGWGDVNLKNPVFYRGDGSIFSSLMHEGEYALFPKRDYKQDYYTRKWNVVWYIDKKELLHESSFYTAMIKTSLLCFFVGLRAGQQE